MEGGGSMTDVLMLMTALYEIRDHIRENDEPNIDLLHDLANKAIMAANPPKPQGKPTRRGKYRR